MNKLRSTAGFVSRMVAPSRTTPEDAAMVDPMKMEVPPQVRDFAEKSIEQAEKAFNAFIDAATKSVTMVPGPATEMSKTALSLTEKNVKAALEHARKLVHAKDMQEAVQLQTSFLQSQMASAGEQIKQFGGTVMPGGFK